MQILLQNLENGAILYAEWKSLYIYIYIYIYIKCKSLPQSWPAQASQYGISYLLHAVSCTSQIWMSLWYTILHWSFLIPFWYTQWHNTAARSITFFKLLWKIMLCSCHRLWFHKWFHYCNAVLHWPLLHLNQTPNITGHDDGQYGSAIRCCDTDHSTINCS